MNTTSAKNRRIRVAVLELLRTEYPGALDLKTLAFALDNLGYPLPDGTLRAHLKYLEEKGHLHLEGKKEFGFNIEFASLSARGWDLIDGHLKDRGIDEKL